MDFIGWMADRQLLEQSTIHVTHLQICSPFNKQQFYSINIQIWAEQNQIMNTVARLLGEAHDSFMMLNSSGAYAF